MKGKLILNDNKTIDCKITKDKNKLTIEFENENNLVPFPVVRDLWSEKGINLVLTDSETESDCIDCNTCLTPIC